MEVNLADGVTPTGITVLGPGGQPETIRLLDTRPGTFGQSFEAIPRGLDRIGVAVADSTPIGEGTYTLRLVFDQDVTRDQVSVEALQAYPPPSVGVSHDAASRGLGGGPVTVSFETDVHGPFAADAVVHLYVDDDAEGYTADQSNRTRGLEGVAVHLRRQREPGVAGGDRDRLGLGRPFDRLR